MLVVGSEDVATLVSALVSYLVAVISVCLRLIAKRLTTTAYGADDWWCLLSLAFYTGWIAVVVWSSIGFEDVPNLSRWRIPGELKKYPDFSYGSLQGYWKVSSRRKMVEDSQSSG